MLSIKELQALYEVLGKKEETLQRIQEQFSSKFKDSQAVFKASYALSNLITFNLLTAQQRISAIFLLIQNFHKEGIFKHPFALTIFQLINSSQEPFEHRMIYELVLDQKRDDYARHTLSALYQKQQELLDRTEERAEFTILKEQFCKKLPKLPESSKSQVRRIINDFTEKETQAEPLQFPYDINSMKEEELSNESFNIHFLRPIPKTLPVTSKQFHWLSPYPQPQIQWDKTLEHNLRFKKVKVLIRKALEQHLSKDQHTEAEKLLDNQTLCVLTLGIKNQNIRDLIKQNPYLATIYLKRLSHYPILQENLQVIMHGDVTTNSLDVMLKVLKELRLPQQLIINYIESVIEKLIGGNHNKDKLKLVRIFSTFLKGLKKSKALNLNDIHGKLDIFITQFPEVDEVQQLRKFI